MSIKPYSGVTWTRGSNVESILLSTRSDVKGWHKSAVANITGFCASEGFFVAIWSPFKVKLVCWGSLFTKGWPPVVVDLIVPLVCFHLVVVLMCYFDL